MIRIQSGSSPASVFLSVFDDPHILFHPNAQLGTRPIHSGVTVSCYLLSAYLQHNLSAINFLNTMASPSPAPGESSSSRSSPETFVASYLLPPIGLRHQHQQNGNPLHYSGTFPTDNLGAPQATNSSSTKKARGRHVPTKQALLEPGKRRSFTCSEQGCGKVFSRAEHLRRHVRSIHMDEKRKAFPTTTLPPESKCVESKIFFSVSLYVLPLPFINPDK